MSFVQRIRRTILATVSGGATQSYNTSLLANGGEVLAVVYTRATASAISTAAGLTITGQQSGITILDVTATGGGGTPITFFPTANAQTTSGELKSWATGAGAVVGAPALIPIGQECINIDIASATGAGQGCSNGGLGIIVDLYVRGN